jgi:O-methyltransferase involved in polyketide biosynthesis
VALYARALESRRKRPILEDPKAVEIVDSIDWGFRRFGQRRRVAGCALRSALFDVWVRDFLRRHPEGTVVEIGAGLSTRFERLDNGRVHWYDLDLPDMVDVRRDFFSDSERRVTLPASVLDPDWIETVRRSPRPYFLVGRAVGQAMGGPESELRQGRGGSLRRGRRAGPPRRPARRAAPPARRRERRSRPRRGGGRRG